MSETFLLASIAGLLLTVNALRPVPWTILAVPSFFAGWLTRELAPQNLVIHALVTVGFVVAGALAGWQGPLALGLSLLSAAGLVVLIVEAQRARDVVERALCEGLGDDYASRILPDRAARYDLRVPWRQLLLPFRMRHPDVRRVRNLTYGERGRRNRLDVYHHRAAPSGAPVLLQIHGGAWVTVSNKDHQGKPLMLHLASRGWVCVAINYPLSPKATWPEHVVDVKRAIAWVRAHVHEFGGDPRFLVVTGGSAGGHLAALVALTQNDPEYQPGFEDADTSVQACVSYYGVYDFTNTVGHKSGPSRTMFLERIVMKKKMAEHREEFEKASPLYRIRPDAPPFFAIHGAHDSLVPVEEARHFVRELRAESQSPVVYAELPGTQHAFDVFPSIRTAHVVRAVERFCDLVYTLWAGERARTGEGRAPADERAAGRRGRAG